jgi:hypothetical protein
MSILTKFVYRIWTIKFTVFSFTLYEYNSLLSRIWGCAWIIDGFLIDGQIYTTCYYTSQTTIWHTMSSLLHYLRLPSQKDSLNSISVSELYYDRRSFGQSVLVSSLYNLWADPQKTPPLSNSFIAGRCSLNVFTEQLPSNGLLLWPHYSGFQASCHNILLFTYLVGTYLWTKEGVIISSVCISLLSRLCSLNDKLWTSWHEFRFVVRYIIVTKAFSRARRHHQTVI